MNAAGRKTALIVVSMIVGAALGALFVNRGDHARAATPEAVTTSDSSLWRRISPTDWKRTLMTPTLANTPAYATNADFPVLLNNLSLIRDMLQDKTIPDGGRYELGAVMYGLAAHQLIAKNDGKLKIDRTPSEVDLFNTAMLAIKSRYEIAVNISPIDAMGNVYYAVTLVSEREPESIRKALLAHDWDVPIVVIEDVLKLAQK